VGSFLFKCVLMGLILLYSGLTQDSESELCWFDQDGLSLPFLQLFSFSESPALVERLD
jgi:hypothetical protein